MQVLDVQMSAATIVKNGRGSARAIKLVWRKYEYQFIKGIRH